MISKTDALMLFILSVGLGFLLGDHFGVNAEHLNEYKDLSYRAIAEAKKAQKIAKECLEGKQEFSTSLCE